MKNETQLQFIKNELKKKGYITRNECLQNYISRLGAIICDLKKDGYDFESDYVKTPFGKDFIYKIKPKVQTLL